MAVVAQTDAGLADDAMSNLSPYHYPADVLWPHLLLCGSLSAHHHTCAHGVDGQWSVEHPPSTAALGIDFDLCYGYGAWPAGRVF